MKKIESMNNNEIENVIDDLFDGIDQNAIDMLDRYKSGDKVKDICADYDISTESFYRMIKPLQDREAGIEPEPIPEPKPKKKAAARKPAAKKPAKPVIKNDQIPEGKTEVKPAEPKAKIEPAKVAEPAKPKKGSGPITGSGVVVYKNFPEGIHYVKNFTKAKGKATENADIKYTQDRKEAKIWRTLYAAVDFLCKREKSTVGWTIAHEE